MTGSLFPARKIYRVSELVEDLNKVLDSKFKEISVSGEISGFKKHRSGHYFFSIKDANAVLQVVMFRFQAMYLKFNPTDGLEVVVRGRLNFYEPQGALRMIADALEPVGVGALQLAFEQMKAKLSSEGLFAPERKKPIPVFCRRIAVITSPTGAVFSDMLKVFRVKETRLQILLVPSAVQGEAAERELERALALTNRKAVATPRERVPLDLIVLVRGGGSLEDLWPFNTERLARAIARSRIPVLSAVGHEGDYTIADMVADGRASTPTAAAERIAAGQQELLLRLEQAEAELPGLIKDRIEQARESLADFMRASEQVQSAIAQHGQQAVIYGHELQASLRKKVGLMKDDWTRLGSELYRLSPDRWLQSRRSELEGMVSQLSARVQSRLGLGRERISHYAGAIHALSPLSTLGRGYAIVRDRAGGKIISDTKQVELGNLLEVILHKGELSARVTEKQEKNRWEDYEPEQDKDK